MSTYGTGTYGAGTYGNSSVEGDIERSATYPVGITDVVSYTLAGQGEATRIDPVGLSDTVTTQLSVSEATAADLIGLSDTVSRVHVATRPQTDPIGILDTVAYFLGDLDAQSPRPDGFGASFTPNPGVGTLTFVTHPLATATLG